MLSNEDLEIAARELCFLRGLDPNGKVPVPNASIPYEDILPADLEFGWTEKWRTVVSEVRALLEVVCALQCVPDIDEKMEVLRQRVLQEDKT